ncbi:MSHA biogenesis protein MshN [Marinobacter persicus]|uniref:MSHA biogenesis protein MshN n=1 Tax=Marinobacter persicus TaxID=930118 RepID=A0A2S6G493_9GAMM|nr:MSHA biogenesis protein MshN [Marinobacter persicus]PPK51818.1 MSHA biogenesis protein MshN [Marinobacter persicus]PPK53928.1 MSHA biogenesis protein MshN [Marinobacter persicus]PPK58749.1 MSHA biogenesis protein MshN [Marinobacter persicus]
MSLLNDALKAAEQRQNRPQVSRAYTGQAQGQPPQRSKAPLLAVLLAVVLAGVGVGWWVMGQPLAEPPRQAAAEAPVPTVRPEPVVEVPKEKPKAAAPQPEPEPIQPVAQLTKPAPEPEAKTPEPVGVKQETQEAVAPEPEPESPRLNSDQPAEQVADTKSISVTSDAETKLQDRAHNPVKQPRETPQAIDRRASRDLEQLLARGRTTEAEQRLTELTARQPAPQSREVFARQMLVQQMPARALGWLPQSLASDHANLRLLRARAQLELGSLKQAVATLRSQVPAVDAFPDYRVTLATLLQQAGEPEAAAAHWSELIEYQNNQPSWWFGLAMALDAAGQANSAARAYVQAAAMPGLSERLASYAKQRIQALQAGS